jgi:UDP:flavonoid glycosyltransferase YjiC (YdhE family)
MSRHIVLVTLGTYGDVLTRVALAEALLRRGVAVTIATYAHFEPLVRQCGAGFRMIPGDPHKVVDNMKQDSHDSAATGDAKAYAAGLRDHIEARRERALSVIDAAHVACADADLIVYGITTVFASSIAESYGVPSRAAFNVPLTPTDRFAAVIAPVDQYNRRSFNKASHRRSNRSMGQSYTPLINFWRHDRAGLPPIPAYGPLVLLEKTNASVLYGCSPILLPRDPAWPAHIEVTGPWRPHVLASDPPAAALAQFVENGPAPIVIGFSSAKIPAAHKALLVAAVQQLVSNTAHRFVILSGWMNLELPEPANDRVLTLPEAPHDWLYPRAACVVHAAGAGSAHAQVAAMVPGVIVPLWGDQFFWARRMAAAGRAIDAGRAADLTGARLTQAVAQAMALDRSTWEPEPKDGSDRAATRLLEALEV